MGEECFYIFEGLPGTGKATFLQLLAHDRQVHLPIDTIEQAFTKMEAWLLA